MKPGDQLVFDRQIDMVRGQFDRLPLGAPPLFIKNYTCTYKSQPEKERETMKRTFQVTFPYNLINITVDDVECCLKTDEHVLPELTSQIHVEKVHPCDGIHITDVQSHNEIAVLKQTLQGNIKALTALHQTNDQLERCNAKLDKTVSELTWAHGREQRECARVKRELKEARKTFAKEAMLLQAAEADLAELRVSYRKVWNECEVLRKENQKLNKNPKYLEEQVMRLQDLKSALVKSTANLRQECDKKDEAVASMYNDLQGVCRDNMFLQKLVDRLTNDLRAERLVVHGRRIETAVFGPRDAAVLAFSPYDKVLQYSPMPYPSDVAFRALHAGLSFYEDTWDAEGIHAFIEDWLHEHMVPNSE